MEYSYPTQIPERVFVATRLTVERDAKKSQVNGGLNYFGETAREIKIASEDVADAVKFVEAF